LFLQDPTHKANNYMELIEELALRRAMQISLLNCVTPSLRRVNVVQLEKNITLNFYYDSIVEGEEELPDEVEAEMWGFYYGRAEISKNIIISRFPNPIPKEGLCVFCRIGEVNQLFNKPHKNLEDEINLNLLISQATQISLLGYVTPNLRKVLLEEEDKKIILHFYYDKTTEKEKELSALISDRVRSFFNKIQIEICTSVLPLPRPTPTGSAIYARYEKL
jgi:hypothetical protein